MMFAIPIAPDQQRHRAEAEQQRRELALGRCAGLEHVRGPAHLDAVGVLGIDRGREQVETSLHGSDGVDQQQSTHTEPS